VKVFFKVNGKLAILGIDFLVVEVLKITPASGSVVDP
jgi:hypothetical protein